ncbi:MAG: S-methyl-5-thioribose-1-phosphate isomerase [Candidatus Omnitrophica bacterium]|nr:S-methyl-5-thioribose-1-phosphate isomerase [Candidatus Omnitrophota bacterium]
MNSPTLTWSNGAVKLIDQTLLPSTLKYIICRDVKTLWQAIKTLQVRGAPALGVAAGFGVLLGIKNFKGFDRQKFEKEFLQLCDYIGSSRPTAVNLFNVLTQMKRVVAAHPQASVRELKDLLKREALAIYQEDRRVCRQIGKNGQKLIKSGGTYLTVCNAGALATVDYGTALGVFYAAKEAGKTFKVYSCETRPLLQGARLTCWELLRAKIDTTLICDNMAGALMQQGKIDGVFAGADRIALNGDAANKIGTYSLAVLAKYHRIPFYIVAPRSTFDCQTPTGQGIVIEQRKREEVATFAGVVTAPKGVNVFNPAFDVTPHSLIEGIVTENGILKLPLPKTGKPSFLKNKDAFR